MSDVNDAHRNETGTAQRGHHGVRTALITFGIGITAAVILMQVVSAATLASLVRETGVLGIFLVGAMYSISFTSPTATVVLVNLHGQFHPLVIATIGAFGSLAYDELIFIIARKETKTNVGERLHRALERLPVPSSLWFVIGGLIIASPLPDELASGMFGALATSKKRFAALSFSMNFIGILLVTSF
ncbi:MAG: hypothetical protein V1907_03005 [Candidatus Kerfeldbacteria bacterium]